MMAVEKGGEGVHKECAEKQITSKSKSGLTVSSREKGKVRARGSQAGVDLLPIKNGRLGVRVQKEDKLSKGGHAHFLRE